MSIDYFKSLTNFLLHLIVLLFLASAETTIFSSIGFLSKTDIWLTSIVYFSIHREFKAGLLFCFLSSLLIGAFTVTPYSLIVLGLILILVSTHFIKNRSFIEGKAYFMLLNFGAVLVFYITLFVSSWLLNEDPISSPKVFSWLISSMITPFFAAPLRFVFWFIDTLTDSKQPFGFEVH